VEAAVPQHLHPEVLEAGDEAQQVMPLQDLVQQDAIEEAAEGKAEDGGPEDPG
jgi:hypothetical protein